MDRDFLDPVRSDGSEIKRTGSRGSLRTAVNEGLAEISAEAADCNAGRAAGVLLGAAAHAALNRTRDGYTGDALHGFAETCIREGTDILRGDGIHHAQ